MPVRRIVAATVLLAALAVAPTTRAASYHHLDGRTITVHAPLGLERGHAILLHGFTGTHAFWRTQPAAGLLYRLQLQGYRVITPDLPYSGPRQGAKTRARLARNGDAGRGYVRGWRRAFHRILHWTEHRYGHKPTIVGGISWGGYHAMQAACATPSLAGWFAISPVVDPGALAEFHGLDTSAMTLDHCSARLAARPGSLSYGDADTRVGVLPQQHLAGLLATTAQTVRVRRYPGLDHTTTPAAIARVLRFTRTLCARSTA